MKVMVTTSIFSITGVPLAQMRFALALAARGHEVDFVIGKLNSNYHFHKPSGIKTIILNASNARSMLPSLVKYFITTRPDVVFSAEDHLNIIVLIAAFFSGSKAKISCSSRVTPFDTYSKTPFTKRWLLKCFARAFMWKADSLTCVSEDMVKQYKEVFPTSRHVCVYNIIDYSKSKNKMNEPVDHPWLTNKTLPVLIAAGSLAPWKGFSDLIQAISILRSKTNVRLLILGDGQLREELQAQIENYSLTDSVQLLGYVENTLKYFSKSDIFVLSSHVEGLPNVLIEAMICGCTPVSTNCPTGPREVLRDGKYGYLVETGNPKAIADGILRALEEPIARDLLQEAAAPFQERPVISRHFKLLGLEY